jgi:hypothetical protein
VMVDVAAGRDTALALSAENAELVPLPAPDAAPAGAAAVDDDFAASLARWEPSLLAVWSPTARSTGFVVDARGLIATDGVAVGGAEVVAVQVSPELKVPARVLVADAARGVAVVWVNPEAVRAHPPVPLPCSPPPSGLDEGHTIVALTAPLRGAADAVPGEVTAIGARAVETDLRLRFGGAGGPVFSEAGVMTGLTFARPSAEPGRPDAVAVARVGILCDLLGAVRAAAAAVPPALTRLPIEPARPTSPAARVAAGVPPMLSTSEFDVALITPAMVERAIRRAGWTGGSGERSPEMEARLGRLTDFGAWSEYFADQPPVLIVRVSPKLVEGFWKRLLREAARTQGAVLPPFKDFSTSFLRLEARCGTTAVAPVHPFVIEHAVAETRVVREGLYVFDPAAFGPACGSVTLTLYGEKDPGTPSTLAIPAAVLEQIRQERL